jgi:hypothetical protein
MRDEEEQVMKLFGRKSDLGNFSTEALEEMAADAREDARHASRRGNTAQRRELTDEAAELRAEIERRRGGR